MSLKLTMNIIPAWDTIHISDLVITIFPISRRGPSASASRRIGATFRHIRQLGEHRATRDKARVAASARAPATTR
jgi:hypothetical protein